MIYSREFNLVETLNSIRLPRKKKENSLQAGTKLFLCRIAFNLFPPTQSFYLAGAVGSFF